MSEVVRAEVVADSPRCELGESPAWDERLGVLSWLDITGRRLHQRDAAGAIRTTVLSEPVTSIGLTDGEHLVGTRADGFASIDPRDGTVTPLGGTLGLPPGDRMNDGGCDPAGRYWAGSMNTTGGTGTASLWRLERSGRVVRILDGLTESNGLAWPSDDPDTLYHVDTPRQRVERLGVDASGAVRARTTVAELEGAPDGLTLDADGNLWVALWGTGRVRQLAPDGTPLREVRLPATSCSNTAFFRDTAGWRLAITTAREDVPPDRLDADDRHGALFVADVPATGVPAHRFHG
ncbi:SMP-30/gluconolactonase/LRE family protein [Pseudonocardia acaciae]|uniref:SMP-30/gluconolactonase/LRE family protein n=1 Tax=Pseudonocardia acaciae TaxID=551276 RepID=UPI000687E340|nr:SMP-30/gluconolactonase/LRE family protein [Pseudonocardia acaciae]